MNSLSSMQPLSLLHFPFSFSFSLSLSPPPLPPLLSLQTRQMEKQEKKKGRTTSIKEHCQQREKWNRFTKRKQRHTASVLLRNKQQEQNKTFLPFLFTMLLPNIVRPVSVLQSCKNRTAIPPAVHCERSFDGVGE